MPDVLESGVAFALAGTEEGCTLLYDSFQRTLLISGPTELKSLPV